MQTNTTTIAPMKKDLQKFVIGQIIFYVTEEAYQPLRSFLKKVLDYHHSQNLDTQVTYQEFERKFASSLMENIISDECYITLEIFNTIKNDFNFSQNFEVEIKETKPSNSNSSAHMSTILGTITIGLSLAGLF